MPDLISTSPDAESSSAIYPEPDGVSGGSTGGETGFDLGSGASTYPVPPGSPAGEIYAAEAVSADPLAAIDWGTSLSTTVVDVYFAPEGTYIDDVTSLGASQGFTAYQKRQILSALEQISKVTNLTFQETTSQSLAEFRLGTFELDDLGAIAFMKPPGDPYAGFLGIDPDYLNWYDADSGNSLLSRGGFMYAVMLEEFGHGLGLAHPHDEGGTSTILEGVDAPVGSYGVGDLNQGVYTMMGWTEGWPAGPYGDQYYDGTYTYVNDFGYEATPMALDIAVLQQKYGSNQSWATGDDVYVLPTDNGLGTFFEAIWDAGGNDTIRHEGSTDAIIDLRAATLRGEVGGGGFISYSSGIRGGFTIAAGVVIENATGGSGHDVMTGNAAANALDGGAGDDRVWGQAAGDLLVGNAGNDRLNGETLDAEFDPVAARVYRLYQATLDREPDQAGHMDWTQRLLDGTSITVVAAGFVDSREFQNIYGETTNEEFVTLLYNNVLDRDPDPSGFDYWLDLLDSGARTRPEVVLGFSDSREFQNNTEAEALEYSRAGHQAQWSDDVFRLYGATLDRVPDENGFLDWTDRLAFGLELESAAAGFVNSHEFQNVYGETTNDEFVTLLYNNVLDRDPDPSGFDYWTDLLDSGALTRPEVVLGFSQSKEYRISTADDLIVWMRGLGEDDRLEGGADANILFGGIGADRFVFEEADNGVHVVAGMESWDWADFSGFGYGTASEVMSHLSQADADVLFQDQDVRVVFTNTLLGEIGEDMILV